MMERNDQRGFIPALIGDGLPLLALSAVALILAGLFALFLAITGHFLPHDVAFLGMSPEALCAVNECRIVHFMIHDRISFGGVLIAIGLLYLWLVEFPLKQRERWAWNIMALSALLGFASFLSYLGYGYLDTWHGVATLGLLPCFVLCLGLSYRKLKDQNDASSGIERLGLGRGLLLFASFGMVAGGTTIMIVGMTTVFVPQDLEFMGIAKSELAAINPRLIPLIAHDRAGFGGGVCVFGLVMGACVWKGKPSPSLWQAVALAGTSAFATAIFVHPAVGYNDFFHLLPAVAGAVIFAAGLVFSYRLYNPKTSFIE